MFTLFAILFVFLGILILAVGLVGEYVGRIYLEVRRRPAYRVRAVAPPRRAAALTMRSVVFAYSRRRLRLPRGAARARRRRRGRGHARRRPGRADLVPLGAPSSPSARGLPVFAPTSVDTPEWLARLRGWRARTSSSPSTTASCCRTAVLATARARRVQPARLAAAASTAAAARSTGCWSTARRETGVTLHYMVAKPDARRHRRAAPRADRRRRHRAHALRAS